MNFIWLILSYLLIGLGVLLMVLSWWYYAKVMMIKIGKLESSKLKFRSALPFVAPILIYLDSFIINQNIDFTKVILPFIFDSNTYIFIIGFFKPNFLTFHQTQD